MEVDRVRIDAVMRDAPDLASSAERDRGRSDTGLWQVRGIDELGGGFTNGSGQRLCPRCGGGFQADVGRMPEFVKVDEFISSWMALG
jgi:hypothetical protein